ncbi:MAG: radical SAM protein [Candidatus Omnitrophota bacterium]|nr:radical SAM protein [Candidatus Omnitrophota bacterium]
MIDNFIVKSYFNYSGYLFRVFPGLLSFVLPRTLVVEASNMCMLKCPVCATVNSSRRQKGVMPFELFKSLIDGIDWKLRRINFSYAGEPLVNPDLFKMVGYAAAKGIDSIVETNGMLLEDRIDDILSSGLYKLNIAFDGINQEMASLYRKGLNFDKVVSGVRRLTRERKKRGSRIPGIHLQFIVMKHNQSGIDAAISMAEELGADFIDFKSMILSGGSGLSAEEKNRFAGEYLPDECEYLRYEKKNGEWQIKEPRRTFCPHILSDAVVMWNGDVTICTMDVEGKFAVGNIKDGSLRSIWKSARYVQLRKFVLLSKLPECRECGYLLSDFRAVRIKEGP